MSIFTELEPIDSLIAGLAMVGLWCAAWWPWGRKTLKIPKKATIKLGRVRRMYIERLLARGLSGDSPAEVIETIFCRGLQACVPAEDMRDAVELADRRKR